MKLSIVSVLIALFLSAGLATALTLDEVKVDGVVLTNNSSFQVERGSTLDIDVLFSSTTNVTGLRLEGLITGADTDDTIQDNTQSFDVPAGVRVRKSLQLSIPADIERDSYRLRLHVTNQDTTLISKSYVLNVVAPRRGVNIKDVLLNPAGSVEAGQELLVGVRVENDGSAVENDVRVQVSIPELDLSAADYIEKLEPDDQAGIDFNSEKALPLRIPRCTAPGDYDLEIEALYGKGRLTVRKTDSIRITKGIGCTEHEGPELDVKIGTSKATLTSGVPSEYTLTIFNNGDSARAVTVVTPSIDWADFAIAPTNAVILEPGASQTLTVTATAKAGAPKGTFTLPLTISSTGLSPQTVALTADIPNGGGPRIVELDNDLVTRLVLIGVLAMCLILGLALFFGRRRHEETRG